jgi:predicted site-specific integrase-resolvase
MVKQQDNGSLLTSREVAGLFGVAVQTVIKWGDQGRLEFGYTPGGARRYWREYVETLVSNSESPESNGEES